METMPIKHNIEEVSDSKILLESSEIKPVSKVSNKVKEENSDSIQKGAELGAAEIAKSMNEIASVFNTSLSFFVDKPTGKTVIRVMDKNTNQVVRQIPPEQMLKLIRRMRDVMGLLLDVQI